MARKLLLSVDVGGSQTKIIYQFLGESPQYLLMSPGVEQISKNDLNLYYQRLGWIGAPSVEQQAWVEWKDNIFVVGDFVREFAPVDRIFERKYENALYKLLAAIGVILSKHEVPSKGKGSKVDLSIGLLLPCNEYNDRLRFEEQFRSMLSKLKFRDQSWKVDLSLFVCMPEGSGLTFIRCGENGVSWFKSHNTLILMFGHRNVTAIYFEEGVMRFNGSPLLGFSVFLDDVCERVSGLERDKLADSIFKAVKENITNTRLKESNFEPRPKWQTLKSIRSLATARDQGLKELEVLDIAQAIDLAIPSYWNRIKKWLDQVVPSMPQEVLLGGGAAPFLEPELEKYFNCMEKVTGDNRVKVGERPVNYCIRREDRVDYASLVWFENIRKQIEKMFDFNFYCTGYKNQPVRLIDCFGMFNHIRKAVEENAKPQKTT